MSQWPSGASRPWPGTARIGQPCSMAVSPHGVAQGRPYPGFAMALCLLSRPLNELVPDFPVVDIALLEGGSLDQPLRIRGIAREVGTDDIDDADIAIMRV